MSAAKGGGEFLQGDGELGFDGFYGEVEEAGDVLLFKAVFFYEREDEFAAGWQLVDSRAEALEGF